MEAKGGTEIQLAELQKRVDPSYFKKIQITTSFPEKEEKSWVHVSYIEGKLHKKTTLASHNSALHEKYGGTKSREYQHDIKRAYPEYLLEKSENAAPPVSKHPLADQVDNGNGFYIMS